MCSDVDENRKVGRLVHEVGKDTDKKLVFVSSCALSHEVVRGPERWPTEERQRLDRKFIELTTKGRVDELTAWMPEFVREGVAEMGGRTISSMVGGIEALAQAAGAARLPVLALGGVTPERVGECLQAGAHGVAAIAAVWNAPDPVGVLERFREALGRL